MSQDSGWKEFHEFLEATLTPGCLAMTKPYTEVIVTTWIHPINPKLDVSPAQIPFSWTPKVPVITPILPNCKGGAVEGRLEWKETVDFTIYGKNILFLQFYNNMFTFLGPSQDPGEDSGPVLIKALKTTKALGINNKGTRPQRGKKY